MTCKTFWALLLFTIALSVPSVFCRYDYAQYYISKYHKVVSTTESISSSKPDLTTAEVASSSTGVSTLKNILTSTDDSSSEEKFSPSEDNDITGPHGNNTVIQHGDEFNNFQQTAFVTKIVSIVGSVLFFVIVIGCMVCCCPGCRGKSRSGFIISDNRQVLETGTHPQQPLVPQPPPPQTTVLVQHYPPNYQQESVRQPYVPPYPQPGQYSPMQQPLPPNQYSPMQPQPLPNQYSPMQPPSNQYSPNSLQYYNPPEAPPPYDDMPSHKY